MKKLFLFLGFGVIATITFLNTSRLKNNHGQFDLQSLMKIANAEAEGGYSCSASSNCYPLLSTQTNGPVSCTGTESCSRGSGWVKCDGNRAEC